MGAMIKYVAKPNFNTNKDMKEFDTAKEAAKYLLKITGYKMPIDEWIMIGKIIEVEQEQT